MSRDRYPHTPAPLRDILFAPGNGYPNNPGQDRPGLSPWGRMCAGGAMGKSTTLIYEITTTRVQPGSQDMINVQGDDMDACQLVVTLAEPRVIPMSLADLPIDTGSSPSGGASNGDIGIDNFPGTPNPLAWPPLEAVIEWGVGGYSASAVVDFVNGVTFSVVASFLRVKAQVSQNHVNGEITGSPAAYLLGAFVGPGVTFSANAQRTVYVDEVANAASSLVFDVPKFARRAYVVGCDETVPAANLTAATLSFFQGPTAAALTNVGNFFQSGNQPTGFPIPNAAQYFTVTNTSGADMKISVVFELALS